MTRLVKHYSTDILKRAVSLLPNLISRRLRNRVPPGVRRLEVLLPNGDAIAFDGLDASTIFPKLFWSGFGALEGYTELAFALLAKRAQTVFDVGSYVGYYALIAARMNARCRILSFEPVPNAARLQEHYLGLNQCTNVQLIEAAVSDEAGRFEFYLPSRSASRIPNIGSLKNRFRDGQLFDDRSAEVIEVRAVRLDDVVRERGIDRIDLLKIDTEETEHRVLKGGLDAISTHHPDIIAEIGLGTPDSPEVFDLLRSLGYRAFELTDRLRELADFADFSPTQRLVRASYGEILFSAKDDQAMTSLRDDLSDLAARTAIPPAR